jgi:hypothetical protein
LLANGHFAFFLPSTYSLPEVEDKRHHTKANHHHLKPAACSLHAPRPGIKFQHVTENGKSFLSKALPRNDGEQYSQRREAGA